MRLFKAARLVQQERLGLSAGECGSRDPRLECSQRWVVQAPVLEVVVRACPVPAVNVSACRTMERCFCPPLLIGDDSSWQAVAVCRTARPAWCVWADLTLTSPALGGSE